MCPSATGDTPDAQITGFVGADGKVGNIFPPIPLTDAVRSAAGPRPERKFRLVGQCIEGKCGNWENQRCGLIGRMREQLEHLLPPDDPAARLQRCAIRASCVWWQQTGPDACRVCPLVTYNPSE